MTTEEKVIESARKCASCYFIKGWKDKLPDAMAELDRALKEYEKAKRTQSL